MKFIIAVILFCVMLLAACVSNTREEPMKSMFSEDDREKVIDQYVYKCADLHNFNSPEYQICLDSGLAVDSTIAYLWQQKAMPYFKQMKYSIGMMYLDKAVQYDKKRWLSYRAFIKCIFQKDYEGAILDFDECVDKYGNSFEMDHTYNFYIGLSMLQLNQFAKAEEIFKAEIDSAINLFGVNSEHHLDLFYLGISKYEQKKWQEAIIEFDKALVKYPNFSDVQYYKSLCLGRLGSTSEAKRLYELFKINKAMGFTINEDNVVYERYPYQLYY